MKTHVLFAIMLLLVMQPVFSADACIPKVNSIYVELTVRDYGTGDGYVELPTRVLELYDYIRLYDDSRIYFSGYDGTRLCSPSCSRAYPERFTANFVVVQETGGNLIESSIISLEEGSVSKRLTSEGKSFELVARNYDSITSCSEADHDAYCADGTEYMHCSVNRPYRCVRGGTGEYVLQYDGLVCGGSLFESTDELCVEDESRYFCDSYRNAVGKRTCVNGQWTTQIIQDCDALDSICVTSEGPAHCLSLNEKPACIDGTIRGACSPDPPFYCNDRGVLIESPKICGCPEEDMRYEPVLGACIYTVCEDGTPAEECSEASAMYCSPQYGLIYYPEKCGCPENYVKYGDLCISSGSTEPGVKQPEEQTVAPPAPVQPTPPVVVAPESEKPAPEETVAPVDSGKPAGQNQTESGQSNDFLYLAIIGVLAILVLYLFLKGTSESSEEQDEEDIE